MNRLHMVGTAVLAILCLLPMPLAAADGTSGTAAPDATSYGNDRLDAKGVGITGGIIGGAELVIAIQAAAGVDKLWPYLVFPVLGAGAGGVGGYYLEKASGPGAVALLVTSVACIIPTAIATASAFSYHPEKEGAVKADTMEDNQFSFELPPDEKVMHSDKEGKTVTDVEKQPETGPPAEAAPAEPPPADAAPTDEASPEAQPPADSAAPSSPTGARDKSGKRSLASDQLPSGTLIHVNRRGAVSMSVPFVDVRPLAFAGDALRADGSLRRSDRLEVHIPLLRVDLP